MRLFHVSEKNVRFYSLRNEICGLDSLFQHVFTAFVRQTEIILCVEYADDVVHAFLAYREIRVSAFVNRRLPFLGGFVHPEKGDFRAVSCDFVGGEVVEFKNVLNEFFFLNVDCTLFAARVNHHTYFLFGHLVLLCVGIDTQQLENAVCGNGEKPYYRGKNYRNEAEHAGHAERKLLRFLHRNSFRNKLAEDEREIRKDKRHDDD